MESSRGGNDDAIGRVVDDAGLDMADVGVSVFLHRKDIKKHIIRSCVMCKLVAFNLLMLASF